MKRLIITFLLFMSLVVTGVAGCSGHVNGIDAPRTLSGEEKAALIAKALTTDEVKQAMDNHLYYQVKINWAIVKWRDNGTDPLEIGVWDYHFESDLDKIASKASAGAEVYAAVVFEMGDPVDWGVTVSINPDTLRIAHIMPHPITPVNN